jgi:hypothetical protein
MPSSAAAKADPDERSGGEDQRRRNRFSVPENRTKAGRRRIAASLNGRKIVAKGCATRHAATKNRARCSLQCVPVRRSLTGRRGHSINITTRPAITAKNTTFTATAAPTRRQILWLTTQNFSPQSRHR